MARSSSHNLSSLLIASACRFPALPALATGDRVYATYRELALRVTQIAGSMRAAGLTPGDRVALVARNCVEYIETLFACWHAGLCAVPVNCKLHADELSFVLQHCASRWAFVDAHWRGELASRSDACASMERVVEFGSMEYAQLAGDHAIAEATVISPTDPAWLFYTSGTTGRPKGVVLTHGNLLAMSRCFLVDVASVDPGDALLHPAPLSHGSGLYVVPHVLRAAVNVVPESGGFEPAEIVALLERWDRACFFAAPTMLKRLIAHPALARARLDHLKSIVCGGAPLYVEDAKAAAAALGPKLAQIYGQGESPMTITAMTCAVVADAVTRNDAARLGSVGIAQAGIELRIADTHDASLPVGEAGEILVRGATVMQGYWMNPDATAATLANGWLHTGDIGVLDVDGFLTLKDRSKDLIISGGSNVYPREVEEVLQQHAAVREVSVVGRHHDDWGEEVVACIVARDGADEALLKHELDAMCLASIARFKRPRNYVFLPELPKNNTGKVLKTVLRDRVRVKKPT
ncbi:MAG: AMP-binding protein [Casimicrobiaceae bacterium]